ncbi:hypothetical protein A8C56_14685 [Niabella ginsenosidivorans]|uniref:Uncharacterized protein n=1 Tax=Niabella ginsenosidivorans TaxID=1176587 RepID=A0A1A9I5T4_9BACT|nr:hypothetical protein [Niabella ginsenosidivorans]ANH82050.1 hypothetical protein A8C56_14685 [Niabella ginsenosidivorans]
MKKIKIVRSLILALLLISVKHGMAQDKAAKEKQELLQDAIAARYTKDASFAQYKRTAINNNLNYWVGNKLADLIAKWGPPTRTTTDGGDGNIIVYENTQSRTTGSYSGAQLSWNEWGEITNYKPAQDTRQSYSYTDYWYVYADKNNIITRVEKGRK